jgi:prevent-host-death family protein
MASIGIRNLKRNLSRVILRVSEGESIDVTNHGRVVARLSPPEARAADTDGFQSLVSVGTIRPAIEQPRPFIDWPLVDRPSGRRGLAANLIDEDRGG